MEMGRGKLKQAMHYANEIGAHRVVVLGDEELETGTIEVKQMEDGAVEKIPLAKLVSWFQGNSSDQPVVEDARAR